MREIKLLFRDNMSEYLNKIKERNPKVKFYSYSKLGTYNQCPKSFYYTYINKKEQKDNVYSILGNACHESLEDVYNGKCDSPIIDRFQNEFERCELFGINFPRSKYDIRSGYEKDIKNFYKLYKKLDGHNFVSELGFVLQIDDDHYILGYIDLLRLNEDGSADIYDFKTSSDFDKTHTVTAGRQLILYKLAIEQLYGIKVNSVAWQMLKYVNVKIGNNKEKVGLKGRDWVSKCVSQIRTLMKKEGYEDLVDMYLTQAEMENSIKCLPQDIQDKIKVDIYTRYYDVTDKMIEDFWKYIKDSITFIEMMPQDELFWNCKVDKFFCQNLCGFYPKYCKAEVKENEDISKIS